MQKKFYVLFAVLIASLSVHAFAQSSCCGKPDRLKVLSVTDSSVCLQWRILDSARCDTPKAYQVQVKPVGSSIWRTRSGNYTGGKYLTSCDTLKGCTSYQWRVRNVCIKNGDTTTTVWVNGPKFKTLCGNTQRIAALGDQTIKVYPNPAYDRVIVSANFGSSGTVKIIIADRTGNKVFEKTASINNNKVELPVDVSRFPPNMYFITLTDGNAVLKTTFIKK